MVSPPGQGPIPPGQALASSHLSVTMENLTRIRPKMQSICPAPYSTRSYNFTKIDRKLFQQSCLQADKQTKVKTLHPTPSAEVDMQQVTKLLSTNLTGRVSD